MTQVTRKVFMLDTETLGKGPSAVVTQVAVLVVDRDDPEKILREIEEYLPIQPQLALGRSIDADTLIYWMDQSDSARAMFKRNAGDDFQELVALVTSVSRKISEELEGLGKDDYEFYARGPQFDFPIFESLLAACGQTPGYRYDRVFDLRTVMLNAGVTKADVQLRAGLIPHVALHDCKYQLDCLTESWRRLHAKV